MKSLILKRFSSDPYRTLGHLSLIEDGQNSLRLATLELPWKNNERSVSCIPQGDYILKPIIRPNKNWALEFQNVPNRTHVLIHKGNYTTDIEGCVLLGLGHDDINGDNITDVTGSGTAMAILERWCKGETEIPIRITGNMITDHKLPTI
jgi:hypothetical protein